MTIASTLQQYLTDHRVHFEMVTHSPTQTASQTAQVSHISGKRIAKGVLLKDDQGYVLAVLPAARNIHFIDLRRLTNRRLNLASEKEVGALFADCEIGAVPPLGDAYGLEMVVDESLEEQSDIYLEGGDHTCLVHISHEDFHDLMNNASHGNFTRFN